MFMKRLAAISAAAVAGVLAASMSANASGITGTEYTNAHTNPVAGYVVQGGNLTYLNSYIGSNNSHSLAALPTGTDNGVGVEACNSATGQAIQVGVQYMGNGMMNVDFATGYLSRDGGGAALPLTDAASNGDWCENGVLSNFDLTGPTHESVQFNTAGGSVATASTSTSKGIPATLIASVPIQDTVQVQLSYDAGSGPGIRHDSHHRGQWLVTAQIVPYPASTGIDQDTNGHGYTQYSAWVTSHFGSFNEAGFGTEANFAQALTPLGTSATYLGSFAHMRTEYNNQGNAYTFESAPGDVLSVDSTSNGDSPGSGGVLYIAPSGVAKDAFSLLEGALIS